MAAAVSKSVSFIEITAIDDDWNYTTTFPDAAGIKVDWIAFSSTADADKISIKDGSATGTRIFPLKTILGNGGFQIVYYHDERLYPYIDFSECTIAGTEQVLIKYRE